MEEATGEEHVEAVRMNNTIWLNAKGCRWSCGGGLIPHCSWSCSGGFGGRRLAEGAAEENAAMEEATGEEHVEAVRMNNTIWLNAKGCSWSCWGPGSFRIAVGNVQDTSEEAADWPRELQKRTRLWKRQVEKKTSQQCGQVSSRRVREAEA